MQGPIAEETPEATPDTTADETKLQAQIETLEEKLRYTERKLTAALGQLRDGTAVNTDPEGRRAALMLALGTGRPYQAACCAMSIRTGSRRKTWRLLRRYGQEGFYDANHLARRLSDLLEGDAQADQTSPQTPSNTAAGTGLADAQCGRSG